ncbi:MAG: hypothetical protein R8G34_01130 [Paracoccaceae bacterium]|nr:hypothetical protein [Paracoccaceae bacterium]
MTANYAILTLVTKDSGSGAMEGMPGRMRAVAQRREPVQPDTKNRDHHDPQTERQHRLTGQSQTHDTARLGTAPRQGDQQLQ